MGFEEVTEASVYACTGQPSPKDIAMIVEWMLNESYMIAYQSKLKAVSLNAEISIPMPLWWHVHIISSYSGNLDSHCDISHDITIAEYSDGTWERG